MRTVRHHDSCSLLLCDFHRALQLGARQIGRRPVHVETGNQEISFFTRRGQILFQFFRNASAQIIGRDKNAKSLNRKDGWSCRPSRRNNSLVLQSSNRLLRTVGPGIQRMIVRDPSHSHASLTKLPQGLRSVP